MSRRHMIVRFGGHWEGSEYKDGEEELLFIPPGGFSYTDLSDEIHGIVEADRMNQDYVLFYVIETEEGKKMKMRIKTDRDIVGLLEAFSTPIVCVTVKKKATGRIAPSFPKTQPSIQASGNDRTRQSFVDLMTSQNPYGCPASGYGMYHMPVLYPEQRLFVSMIQPFSGQYDNQLRPPYAPNTYESGPSTAVFKDIPGHDYTSNVDQLGPSSTPFIKQPQPIYASYMEQRRQCSPPIIEQRETCSGPILDKTVPSSVPNFEDENETPWERDWGGDRNRFEDYNHLQNDSGEHDHVVVAAGGGDNDNHDHDHDDDSPYHDDDDESNDDDAHFEDELQRSLFVEFCGWIRKRGGIFPGDGEEIPADQGGDSTPNALTSDVPLRLLEGFSRCT